MPRKLFGLPAILLAGSVASAAPKPAACVMTDGERAWAENALQASDYVMEQRLHLPRAPHPTIILFNEHCRFESTAPGKPLWKGEAHSGKIRLLKGSIPAGVVAMEDYDQKTGEEFFAMALPSIWQAAGLMKPGDQGLTAVFLHEFSHSRQSLALRPVFDAAAAQYAVPDYFNDDSLQKRFEKDPAYVAVYEKEAGLLYRAAAEPDETKARALARQALELMEARQKRWFTGADAMWKPWDDIYLTMEGFGQWNAYAWLSDPKGGGMTMEAAREKMRGKRRWWSQEEGLGLFLVIDRFVPDWQARAFASRPALGIDLLRLAAEPAAAANAAS
ncbi:MAG TPA: hypothetical protein VF027_10355 [Sphingomicrobium sp.]